MKPIMVLETGNVYTVPVLVQGEWTTDDTLGMGDHLNDFQRTAIYRNTRVSTCVYAFIYQDRQSVSVSEFYRPGKEIIKESGREKIINRNRKRVNLTKVIVYAKSQKLPYKLKTYCHINDYFYEKMQEGDSLELLQGSEPFEKCKNIVLNNVLNNIFE